MKHPVTGEDVPDPTDQVVIYKYLNPRPAEWPKADYVVSNPPFIGTKKIKRFLSDEYIEALRKEYSDLPATIDYAMYWWHKCVIHLKDQNFSGFGLIATNTNQT